MSYIQAAYSDTDVIVNDVRYIHWHCLSAYVKGAYKGQLCAKTDHQRAKNEARFNGLKQQTREWALGDWHSKFGYKGEDVMKLRTHPMMDKFEKELKLFNAENLENITARRRKRKRIYTEDNGEYDYERAQETDFCMQDWKPRYIQAQAHGLIDVVCEFGGSARLSNSDLENSGLAACAMTDALETMGYSVRVVCVKRGDGLDVSQKTYSGNVCQSYIIKDYGEALNIGRVGLALATGQFYRCTAFAAMVKLCIGLAQKSLGAPVRCGLDDINKMSWGVSNNCILIERMVTRASAADAVKKFIERKKKQAVDAAAMNEVGYGYDKR